MRYLQGFERKETIGSRKIPQGEPILRVWRGEIGEKM